MGRKNIRTPTQRLETNLKIIRDCLARIDRIPNLCREARTEAFRELMKEYLGGNENGNREQ